MWIWYQKNVLKVNKMTKFDYYKCDECGKILENCECSPKQLMYTLIANYDTNERYKAHFCSQKCLKSYVDNKVKEHYDLPNIEDGDRDVEGETLGDVEEQKERKLI